jgi:hypothetical protein
MAKDKDWERYEVVAVELLNRFAKEFDVDCFEGKQDVQGECVPWEIDGKGVNTDDGAIVVVECRRRKARQSKESIGAFALKIQDLGAKGGIHVSPLELQSGGRILAAAKDIIPVRLNPTATGTDYVMQFLGKVFAGVRQSLNLKEKWNYEIRRNDGTIERGE